MKILNFYKQYLFYKRKHGIITLLKLFYLKLWRNYIYNKEAFFMFDLNSMEIVHFNYKENLIIENYEKLEKIPEDILRKLYKKKSEEVIIAFFNSFFNRGAVLWIAHLGSDIVGLQWTLVGGFNGFYSIPLHKKDVILLAAEIFPEYRGRKLYAAMTGKIFEKLKENGFYRVLFKVHITNKSSLRCAVKTNSEKIGVVRTIKVFNKNISIWDSRQN